jgi:molybdate transport system substrate-binding protein
MGGQVDLLFLADDTEARQRLLPKGYTLRSLASNELVVIAPKGTQPGKPGFEQTVLNATELAVADPKTAPLGSYTEQALRELSLKAKLVPLQDAQAVLSTVALGHAAMGIVYRSDALAEPAVSVICTVPSKRHKPVRYVAVLPPTPTAGAQQLVDSLVGGQGREVMARHGFLPALPDPHDTSAGQ